MIRNRMKEHRARLGLKQEELAKLVGVRRETIGEVFTVEPDGPAEHS